jgi:glycosyltransferase involved in cell wall biosynthesis
MAVDFTVAICTYNGARRIPLVLDHLQQQVGTQSFSWEVLVIDNNSRDETATVVENYRRKWRADVELKYIFEAKQGVAYARQRAMQEARSAELVGFLDDDNLPAENWVAEAYAFGDRHPNVGAYGGIIHAKLDVSPPTYFNQIKLFFAIYNRGPQPFRYDRAAKPRRIPAAPGSVVRKQAWQDCIPATLLLQGRDETKKTMLGSCEDLECMYYIQNSHWEVWHNPKMEIWHYLPSHRLEEAYLLKIARTSGMSNHPLRIARLQDWQRPMMIVLAPLYLISDGYKLLSYYLKHHRELSTDVSKACELQSRIGKLISPFIHHQWS